MDYGGLWWIVRAIERVDERVVKVDERWNSTIPLVQPTLVRR